MAEVKRYKVVVSPRARQMLAEHIRFLARVSKDAARAKKQQLIAELHTLAEMPERYPLFQEYCVPPDKYHKMFLQKRYIALYQIRDDTVYVDYIVDCRQDYQWLLGE